MRRILLLLTIILLLPRVNFAQSVYKEPISQFINNPYEVIRDMYFDDQSSIPEIQTAIDAERVSFPDAIVRVTLTGTFEISASSLQIGSNMLLLFDDASIDAADNISVTSLISVSDAEYVCIASGNYGRLNGNNKDITGISISNSGKVHIDSLRIENCSNGGISYDGRGNDVFADAGSITRSTILNCSIFGINISDSYNFICTDNVIDSCGVGIKNNASNALIAYNTITECNNSGMYINGISNVSVYNDVSNSSTGITVESLASKAFVSSNSIADNTTGLVLNSATAHIYYNTFLSNTTKITGLGGSAAYVISNQGLAVGDVSAVNCIYFNPPTDSNPHQDLIKKGKTRVDIDIPGGTISSIRAALNSAHSANPTAVIVAHLKGDYITSGNSDSLLLKEDECILLEGTMSSGPGIAQPIVYAKDNILSSFSGGTIDGNKGSTTEASGRSLVYITDNAKVVFDGVTIVNSAGQGFTKRSHYKPVYIRGCTVNNSNGRNIWHLVGEQLFAVENTCMTGGKDGIDFDAYTYGDVAMNNILTKNSRHGIFIEEGAHSHIVFNNVCNENLSIGISLFNNEVANKNTSKNLVANNQCNNNKLRGLHLSARENDRSTRQNVLFNNEATGNEDVGIGGMYNSEKTHSNYLAMNILENNQAGNFYVGRTYTANFDWNLMYPVNDSSLIPAWDGSVDTAYAGGDGSEATPYLIATPAQLAYLSHQANSDASNTDGLHFKLAAEINLGGLEWTPIGNPSIKFGGHFDGDNYAVYGLVIRNSIATYQGLFGYIQPSSGTSIIKNLTIASGYIDVDEFAGGFAGRANNTAFYNCTNHVDVKAKRYTAGISGRLGNKSMMEYCTNTGTIIGAGDYAGGIVSNCFLEPNSIIRYCSNSGNITTYTKYAGGIIGAGGWDITVEQCYNTGKILALQGASGGIIGYAGNTDTKEVVINNCYNLGEITGLSSGSLLVSGGIVGSVSNSYTNPKYFKSISNCYNAGINSTESGSREAIVGQVFEKTGWNEILNCYSVNHTIPNTITNILGGELKDSADMVIQAFADLLNTDQAEEIWELNTEINENGFPILAWQDTVFHAVEGVLLDSDSLTILIGVQINLNAGFIPANADDKTVDWGSTDESVATVTDGVVHAISEGTATIWVRTNEGGFTDSCRIAAVSHIAVQDVSLNTNTITMDVGQQHILTAYIHPFNAVDQTVTWGSTDESVATVTDGTINALAEGTVKIWVKTNEGSYTDSCTVTVNPIAVTGVSLSSNTLTLDVDEQIELIAQITPLDAANQIVNWGSTNELVATVKDGMITAIAEGTTDIWVKTDDGSFTDSCTVTVNPIAVTGVSLSSDTITLLIEQQYTLAATLTPIDAANQKISWGSTVASVASVDDGFITAVAEGITNIWVKTDDGGFSDSCIVFVNPIAVTGVSLSEDSIELDVNQQYTLLVSIMPDDATYQNVSWGSTEETIATVNNGIITALAKGEATIWVETADGPFRDSCTVIVRDPISVYNAESSFIKVYPNPTDGNITISGLKGTSSLLRVFNSTGVEIINKGVINKQFVELDLEPGIYLLKVDEEVAFSLIVK